MFKSFLLAHTSEELTNRLSKNNNIQVACIKTAYFS